MMISKMIKWLIVLVLLFVFGCDLPLDRRQGIGKIQDRLNIKLDGIIGIDSQIGSVIGYNLQRIRDPYMIGDPPSTQAAWMIWHVQNIKLGKNWRR